MAVIVFVLKPTTFDGFGMFVRRPSTSAGPLEGARNVQSGASPARRSRFVAFDFANAARIAGFPQPEEFSLSTFPILLSRLVRVLGLLAMQLRLLMVKQIDLLHDLARSGGIQTAFVFNALILLLISICKLADLRINARLRCWRWRRWVDGIIMLLVRLGRRWILTHDCAAAAAAALDAVSSRPARALRASNAASTQAQVGRWRCEARRQRSG